MKGNVSGYVCNHGSPSGERDTASPRLRAMLRTQASDEEADDVFARRHLYCGTPVVTSWAVAGQQVVFFSYVASDRVTLRAFPVATPRGRSVSFPTRGTMVTYVTWNDSFVDGLACLFLRSDPRLNLIKNIWGRAHIWTPPPPPQYLYHGYALASFSTVIWSIWSKMQIP